MIRARKHCSRWRRIFNSADWFNAGNGFGMGGNLLAAALIGLIGILIAGINTQSMR